MRGAIGRGGPKAAALKPARREAELLAQCALVRCVFGNPFRPPVSFSLLDAARLAILADALEEAGAEDPAALQHLCGPGPHCRGCHCVDAVLGRG